MLQPQADIVLTHFSDIRMILVDLTIPKCKETEDIVNSLAARKYGITCSNREAENGYKLTYSLAWDGEAIIQELMTQFQCSNAQLTVKAQ